MSETDTNTDGEFLRPEQLGVTEEQFCSLMRVAEGLQSGQYVHAPGVHLPSSLFPTVKELHPYQGEVPQGKKAFNMGFWQKKAPHCGSVCCIGGWAGMFDMHAANGGRYGYGTKELFFPPGGL